MSIDLHAEFGNFNLAFEPLDNVSVFKVDSTLRVTQLIYKG